MNKSEIEKRKAETKDARSKIADVITSSQTIAKPNVVGRSEQLQNCNCKRFEQKVDGRFYCRDCGKVEYTVL